MRALSRPVWDRLVARGKHTAREVAASLGIRLDQARAELSRLKSERRALFHVEPNSEPLWTAIGERPESPAIAPKLRRVARGGKKVRVIVSPRDAQRGVVEAVEPSEEPLEPRPRTRADCIEAPRPCPWVSCRWHLFLDAKPNGALVANFPDLEVDEMLESCALDFVDRYPRGAPTDLVGSALNITHGRVQQIEAHALDVIETALRRLDTDEPLRTERGKRRLRLIQGGAH